MTHKRICTLGILIILGSLFAVMGVLAHPEEDPPGPASLSSALCDVPPGAGELFRQVWSRDTTLPDERYVWQVADEGISSGGESFAKASIGQWQVENLNLLQTDTSEGLSVAYETARDIGDGVIEGCMQFTSDISGTVTGGIVFRFQDIENGYGVGFARIDGEVVFALGKMVEGYPEVLTATVGYDPTLRHHVKIVLRGKNIKVYIDAETTPVFDIDDISFMSGKIGYATYSSSARFGPLWADLDCSEFERDLSPIGLAVQGVLTPTVFCSNQYQDLTVITQDEASGRRAFEQMANAIAGARYEVDLTTLSWYDSLREDAPPEAQAGNIILQGLEKDSGIKELYRRFVTNPRDYPQGMRVRILIGAVGPLAGKTYDNVLKALETITVTITGTTVITETGIDLHRVVTDGAYSTTWTIEVAEFRKRTWSLNYSHAKLLVVDGRTVIAGGYNVHNYYTGIDDMKDDMGLQVRGAVGFEAQTVFDSLWYDAKLHPSEVRVPADPYTESTFNPTNPYVIEHAPQIWSHTLVSDTTVFSLYRDHEDKTSDKAI